MIQARSGRVVGVTAKLAVGIGLAAAVVGLIASPLDDPAPGRAAEGASPTQGAGAGGGSAAASGAQAPNVVMILVDDLRASDLEHMPQVRKRLGGRGMTFPNFTTTVPTCCPSRASFLRGQYAHNHNVGHGAKPREASFRKRRLDRSTVGTWMQAAGYRTGYFGKYLNGYDVRRVPPGWNRWVANFDRNVWARVVNVNGTPRSRRGNLDARLGRAGDRFALSSQRPFFLWQNFNAPHQLQGGPPPAPAGDRRRFRAHRAPRTGDFNKARPGMPPHILDSPRLNRRERRQIDVEHRARLASLQVVDRQVKRLIVRLRESGQLADTFIFFTSDNGYHMGQRRLGPGKMSPLLSDVRVPLLVRGPGIEAGAVRDELVQNTDFAPTVAELGGAATPGFVDGRSIAPLLFGESPDWRRYSLFEARPWQPGAKGAELRFAGVTTDDGYHYVEYPDGFAELYDLNADPDQLRNLAATGEPGGPDLEQLAEAREALMSCAADSCRQAEGP